MASHGNKIQFFVERTGGQGTDLCTVFILDKNQLTVGDLDYSILIDQDKGEKMFF